MVRFDRDPKFPTAGHAWKADILVIRKDTGKQIRQGRVTCEASIAERKAVPVLHKFRQGLATCVWNIPRSAGGKHMQGSIAVTTAERATARRFFGAGIARG